MSNIYPIDKAGNYRYPAPQNPTGPDTTIEITTDSDQPQFDPDTGTTTVPQADGTVVIAFGPPTQAAKESDFDDNLAELLDQSELSALAERLLRGIESDDGSRSAWLANMEAGLALLGLEIKIPRGAATAATTPSEGISTIDSPLLLEAVLRFQANARAELLPADGPIKVRIDGESNAVSQELAGALQKDLNHYLTVTAKEYYPDTDRMLLLLGFGGISFKKGFHDPIKQRPVISSIMAKDLIVSNASTNLEGAGRVTHQFKMRPSMIKRMQMVGAYRDVALWTAPPPQTKNPVDTKIDQIQGVAAPAYVDEPEDRERDFYETYCEVEIPGFEHKFEGKETGLPLPYKVVIDKDARQILEIRRNWDEEDPFCMPINRIVAYIFIPGLGFYGIGLLNVLGNTTKAMTAAWRLLLDSGMYANFPGFLYLKQLGKQMTNQFRVPPGGGLAIDGAGFSDIRQVVMPLPYKDPSAVFIQLTEQISSDAQRVGGTAELQVGEGKPDAPVGTTLALIEQATKIMSAVHKRLHQNQMQEFDMLKSLLMEDPEALWRHNKKSAVLNQLAQEAGVTPILLQQQWAESEHRQKFLAALSDVSLIPAADPNTSSQTERYLKVMALRQMAMSNPNIDMDAVDQRAMKIMGIDDAQSMFKPPQPPPQGPSPEQQLAQAAVTEAQARVQDSQTRLKEAEVKAQSAEQDRQFKRDQMVNQSIQNDRQRMHTLGLADLKARASLLQQSLERRDRMMESSYQMGVVGDGK